ncbi:DMT family transporter [Streptomyces sp. OE57]|uniref:DMT family transporter n=1 Tax=Streptomyces lacaronensis TaxID=3379885 RepID=UPI0039B75EC3
MKSRIDPLTVAAMAVNVVAFAATAPLTAVASASPLAMAFWRNALGFVTLGPFLLLLRRREVVRITRGERGLLRRAQWRPLAFGFLASTSIAVHFATFMMSAQMTSIAMSTALVNTTPVWQALIAAGLGVRVSGKSWAGLTLAVVGVVAASGLDVQSGGTELMGDLLAVAGGMAQAGYNALSEKARTDISTPLYSTVASLVCGVELLAVCWLADAPLTGLDTSTKLSLLGLLLLPQLLGLGALNFTLGRASATTVSAVLLLEAPVAALGAWWLMGQSIKLASVPGLLLIIVGVAIVVTSGGGKRTEPRQGKHRKDVPPYPAHTPYTPQPPFTTGESTAGEREHDTPVPVFAATRPTPPQPQPLGHHAKRDPRVQWAGLGQDDSPTITLTAHGAGAFGTMFASRPHAEEARAAFDDPTET